jgi:hypothetical protein
MPKPIPTPRTGAEGGPVDGAPCRCPRCSGWCRREEALVICTVCGWMTEIAGDKKLQGAIDTQLRSRWPTSARASA